MSKTFAGQKSAPHLTQTTEDAANGIAAFVVWEGEGASVPDGDEVVIRKGCQFFHNSPQVHLVRVQLQLYTKSRNTNVQTPKNQSMSDI